MYTLLPLRHALFAFVILFASVALFTPHIARSQSSSAPLTGYAWSENIGWVSFNCLTGGPTANNICATSNYAMNIASDGTLSGYAWSEHIGWISANAADLAGCPTAPCTAKMTGAALNGWFKALSADNKGWDGWINLSGSGYGPTLSSGGVLAGYAWGSDVVGWLQFDGGSAPVSTTWQPCTANYFCTGNAQYYQDGMCLSTFQQNCSYQCSAGVCIAPPPPAGTLAGGVALKVTPPLRAS